MPSPAKNGTPARPPPRGKTRIGIRRTEGAYLLARLGLTQKTIADAVGVDISTVNRWIQGETKPKAEQRKIIAKLYGIDEEDWDRPHTTEIAPKPTNTSPETAPLAASLQVIAKRDGGGDPYLLAIVTKIEHAEMRCGDSKDLTALEADKRIQVYEDLFETHLERLRTSDVRWLLANYDRTIAEVCGILEPHPELRKKLAEILDKVDSGRLLKRNF